MSVSQNTEKSQTVNKNILFIQEITRQLSHPEDGLPKEFNPPPITLGDWKRCLNCLYGWVNIGIDKKMVSLFHSLNIGEIIPSNSPNMDIYKNEFSTNEIHSFLKTSHTEKPYRVIINYYSFFRMIKILLHTKSKEYCIKLNKSLKDTFSTLQPNTFWLSILIPKQTADYLILNKIGEVIVDCGDLNKNSVLEPNKENYEPREWLMDDSDEDILDENIDEDITIVEKREETKEDFDNNIDQFSKMKICNDDTNEEIYETLEDKDINNNITYSERAPYRLVMNNKTLLTLITYACEIHGNVKNYIDVFKLMGGDDDDLTNLFGEMQI